MASRSLPLKRSELVQTLNMLTGDDNDPSDWTVANLLEVIRKKLKEGKGKRPDDDDKTLGDIAQEKESMQTIT